jgi:hypothetical protein
MSQPPPLPGEPPMPRKSGLAIWSLVLGILSLTCFSILSAIPAVICGHTALSRIRRSAGTLKGEGLAIGGLITGYMSIVAIPFIGLMAAIAIPNFVKARTTAQMNYCINNLRQIDGAKQMWALEHRKEQSDTPTPQEIKQYLREGFESFHCPAGGTYSIRPVGEPPTCSIPGHELPRFNGR